MIFARWVSRFFDACASLPALRNRVLLPGKETRRPGQAGPADRISSTGEYNLGRGDSRAALTSTPRAKTFSSTREAQTSFMGSGRGSLANVLAGIRQEQGGTCQ